MTYTLTGTIQDVVGYSDGYGHVDTRVSPPVAKGDRLAWTIQYDRSSPVAPFPSNGALAGWITFYQSSSYSPSGPLITHLVDQTNGFHVYTSPPGSFPAGSDSPGNPSPNSYSGLGLTNVQGNGRSTGSVSFGDYQQSTGRGTIPYFAELSLNSNHLLSTVKLTNLQLDRVPFRFNDPSTPADEQFYYRGQVPNSPNYFSFGAQISSVSAADSIEPLPEPGALTLFVLGAAGLAVRRFRRVLEAV